MFRIFVISILIFNTFLLSGQNKFIDSDTRNLFDSLDYRIKYLENQIPRLSSNRDAQYFSTKRELDMTIFLREYEEMIFDEDLLAADRLIDSKIKASEKRSDKFAIDFYKLYQTKLTRLRGEKRTYYQKLFEKEKNFRKEFEKYVSVGDEYSLNRAKRMVELAINYAEDQQLKETLVYLHKYKKYAIALIYDLHSDYDLKKLTASEQSFQKVFEPMLDSDSLNVIIEAGNLVDQCYNYSYAAGTKPDTNFFGMQRIAVANSVADWNERQGITAELASLTGQSVIARLDSINREGIYQWRDMILVIGTVKFNSKSDNVRRGEAIIDSDQTLLNYIRVNKLSKIEAKNTEIGKSYMVPYSIDGNKSYYFYNQSTQQFQYMICYTDVVNQQVTKEMIRFLPPLQFQEEIGK